MEHLNSGSLSWKPSLKSEADALLKKIENFAPEQFRAALDAEALLRSQAFERGVKAYHKHPYQRDVEDAPAIWCEGGSFLRDYGGPEDGPVILCVPSLINRAYVMDLSRQNSFLRSMVQKGMRGFLLDWGDVGEVEKNMSLEDYILGRLKNALDHVHGLTGRGVTLVGYCMGGVLTTALSVLEPDKVDRLVLLATPWDFHAGEALDSQMIRAGGAQLEVIIKTLGLLPVDIIQMLFAAIDPYQIVQKFVDFSALDPDSEQARKFVAMEDWLNDGVPLGGEVARACLFDWYGENLPARGLWEMDGHYINPAEIQCPTLMFIPQNDRIVPPQSALALAQQIEQADVREVQAGHIGMMVGRTAKESLYLPVADWLLS